MSNDINMKNCDLIGKPSIDKPWQKYFSQEAIDFKLENQTMYNYMIKNAIKIKNAKAINFYGTKISFDTVIEKITSTAKALKQIGINKDDVVMALMPSTPEAVYLIYALNRIGAIITDRKSTRLNS